MAGIDLLDGEEGVFVPVWETAAYEDELAWTERWLDVASLEVGLLDLQLVGSNIIGGGWWW